ncbi:polysaccharide pyruvyl transferase family protein [Clostridium tyrobutyricum]|uniref:polysaccharide pyruvyl transferase family protein n=1 Tax=Clostridium tyrobutyricum TaxID=1519 RepID=UPI00073D56F3|nr:polysaccharide pyruvyl transferase family protein [Clostridium tyrobutyricum]
MKVSIITLQAVKNYGSVLQAFATQEKFKEYGLDVEIVNFVRKDCLKQNLMKTWIQKDNGIKRFLKIILLYPTLKRWERVFGGFLDKYLNLTKKIYTTEKDFIDSTPEADIYCTGSDQVWNTGWNKGIVPPLYLSYAPDNKKKIAFAASFGNEKLDKLEIKQIQKYLKRYDLISVRENSAVKILDEIGIKNSKNILDPTLIMDKNFWLKYIKNRMIKKDYLLIYQLNSNKNFDDYAKKLAKQKGLKLIRLCTRYDQILENGYPILIPSVEKFISLFYYASLVITDSFHGTAFSINLNRNFISIYPSQYGGRIEGILDLVGLQKRHLTNYSDFNMADKNIDYFKVNDILLKERMKVNNFLKLAIS